MNNAIFILTDIPIEVSRLHICTWDLYGEGAIEIGLEFRPNSVSEAGKINKVEFILSLPFINLGDEVSCLAQALVGENSANSKFVFNDTVKTTHIIKEEPANGSVVEFRHRDSLAILPVYDIKKEDGQLVFSVNNVDVLDSEICNSKTSAYVRILIKTKMDNFVVKHRGITKTSYLYDIKINEMRNVPDRINRYLNQGKSICEKVAACFCLHVVPSNYHISYVDSSKLKNIRILESAAFNRYLPIIHSSDNEYIILFLKDKMSETESRGTYSFFSSFEKERIGDEQIIISIVVNLLCSLFIGIAAINNSVNINTWYESWEVWVVISALISLILYLTIPWSKIWHHILRWKRTW